MSKSVASPKPTIVFFGNERLATGVTTLCPTLHALIDSGYTVAAVVTDYKEVHSRSTRTLEIKNLADKHNIPVLLPRKPADIIEQLRSYDAAIGVLVAYGKIIPKSVIDLFPRGIINIHPSLLPLHRGPTPIESVLLSDERKTGVSIMQLSKAMDAGPVYAQQTFDPSLDLAKASKQLLADTSLSMGGELLLKHLPAIIDGSLTPKPQNNSKATYDSLIQKSDGEIDWKKPAEKLEREIRAYAAWPGSRTVIAGKQVTVIEANVTTEIGHPGSFAAKAGRLILHCAYGALEIKRLKPAGKPEMSAQAFLAGNKL